MNTFESSVTSRTGPRDSGEARDIPNSTSHSPTHVDSGLSSSYGSSRSHSSFSSRKYAGTPRSDRQRSSESTPVFDEAGASTRNYGATEAPNSSSAASGPTSSDKQSAPGPSNGANGRNSTHQQNQQEEPHQSRYSRFVDRFGALELENKGSVARDHLALGMALGSHDLSSNLIIVYRANLFSLDAHLPCLCLHWYRRHAALPSQYLNSVYKCIRS